MRGVLRVSQCRLGFEQCIGTRDAQYRGADRDNAQALASVSKLLGPMLLSLDQDVRVGGTYRLVSDIGDSKTMAFIGKYIEITQPTRLSWTNEEGDDGAVTTVTYVEKDGQTHLTFSELYPTEEVLDRDIGSTEGLPEQFTQLEALHLLLVCRR